MDVQKLSVVDAIGLASRLASQSPDAAIECYRAWLVAHPNEFLGYAIAFNLGVLLKDTGKDSEAELAYREAIRLNPASLDAHFNLGSQLERLGRQQDAINQWKEILLLSGVKEESNRKVYILTLNNLGRILEIQRNFPEAEYYLKESLELDPEQPDVMQHYIYIRQKQCSWPAYAEVKGVSNELLRLSTGPLSLLSLSDDPEVQLDRMRRYAAEKIPDPGIALSDGKSYAHQRIRIGYLSSDYCLHPVSMLTVELFELHDREQFEIYGFCWSKDDSSALRKRVVNAFDHYIPIGQLSDEDAAKLICSHEIDVLVDLHGLTLGARPGIISWRPAPVQLTYLGFPGTTGIPGLDYVLADRFLIPKDTEKYYSERIVVLPKSFQVSDRHRQIAAIPRRSDFGLPEDKIVYCCFNNNHKFTPDVFSVWMRILKRVPESVLWLLAENEVVQNNLAKVAEESGISRDRLIFAGRVAPDMYLARFQLADMFLDTFPFGAGTTANDVLWMGLPMVTCPGKTFASRMAGSLLNTLGLNELIADSFYEYENIAVFFGKNDERRAGVKSYLTNRIKYSPLFDIPSRVSDIENVYRDLVKAAGIRSQRSHGYISYEQIRNSLTHFSANYAKLSRKSELRIEVVSATRMSKDAFWAESALGKSLLRLAQYVNINPVIAYENSVGLPFVYNSRIVSTDNVDVIVFMHDDVWIDDYYFVDRIEDGLRRYDLIGVAGNRWQYADQPGWAFIDQRLSIDSADNLSGMLAHGASAFGELTAYGLAPADCELLDGVFLAGWKRVLRDCNVRFDQRFDFHFYDMDFCRTARQIGLKLGTWPICMTHQSEGAYYSEPWQKAYAQYKKKWAEETNL